MALSPFHIDKLAQRMYMYDQIEVEEGDFPPGSDSTIALLSFESYDKAESWVSGADNVKNADWLGKADIITVPVKNSPGKLYVIPIWLCGAFSKTYST